MTDNELEFANLIQRIARQYVDLYNSRNAIVKCHLMDIDERMAHLCGAAQWNDALQKEGLPQ